MNKKLKGKWVLSKTTKTWPEGIAVLIHRTERKSSDYNFLEVKQWFRPDHVSNERGYGTEPMKFMRLT